MRLRFARALAQSVIFAASALVPALSPLRAQAGAVECTGTDAKEVRTLKFVGNTTFSSDELSARVITTPSSLMHRYFGWFFNAGAKRCYPEGGLGQDTLNLKQFYLNNGFYDAKVDTVVTPAGRDAVNVMFRINEGQPVLVDTLTITGLEGLADTARILRNLRMRVGGRFGIEPMYTDADSITRRLNNSGYPKAQVLKAFSKHQLRASVEFQVSPGPLAHIGTIAVTSLSVRNGPPDIDSTVVRKLLGFRSGDQYSDAVIADAQRNLYNLGAFRHVGIAVDTTKQHSDSVADIVVDLREDYLRQYSSEEGWAILDCFRVSAQYTDLNFLDRAQRLELTGRVSKIGFGEPTAYRGLRDFCARRYLIQDSVASSKLNYHLGGTITRPTLFGTHWVPSYSAYTDRTGEYEAFLRTTYIGFEAAATRALGKGLPFRAGYSMEYGRTEAQPAVFCALFVTCERAAQDDAQRLLRLAVASASIQRIRVDNEVRPTRGYSLGSEVRVAGPFVGSDPSLTFLKTTADATVYQQLWSRIVAVARIRGGLISGNGSKLPPPQERLYAGGATGGGSVRGFQQNELGPVAYLLDSASFVKDSLNDSTFAYVAKPGAKAARTIPLGGNTQLVFNVELRIRDPFFPELLEYVPFVDGGQVWTQTGRPSLKGEELKVTPGLGIRYFSPVGPIQLNAGYNPYRSRPGPAYFASPVDQSSSRAPLLCVTGPGVPIVPIHILKGGGLDQNISDCPNFVPSQSSNFLKHLAFTLSITTGF